MSPSTPPPLLPSDEARRRAHKPVPPPTPAYLPSSSESPLIVDRDLYAAIQQRAEREVVETFTIPIRSGRAWKVPAKAIVRISTPEGPQVGEYENQSTL